ncbi:MAG: glycoside hydrolase family 65 protein, partial [Ktedonobacterales bacterium]|nr:glycoside hydrolase family 65 protein [Ktedonobacterales bacterium]
PVTLSRVVSTALGHVEDTPGSTALTAVRHTQHSTPSRLLAAHARAWRRRWRASDVVLEGDTAVRDALRFALYHLLSAANPETTHTSIGARALTGEAYLGHVFWDTDIFVLPFYTFTWPEAARALLLYRYQTLPAARAKAARLGYQGAFYAWESADTGEEATPASVTMPDGQTIPIRGGTDEQHISADVAYAAWQYWQVTADDSFLLEAGAAIVLETARFWASRATLEDDERYHIRGVIGPDEYHEGVDDNAYTNGMAHWNLSRGVELTHLLAARWPARWAELRSHLDLTRHELTHWQDVAERLVSGLDPATGLLEQFEGFFQLETLDLAAYATRNAPIDVLLGRDRVQQTQVIKQADVVMLLALLEEQYPAAVREVNFRYYEPRSAHGSSLSPAAHAWVAARQGNLALAQRYLRQTAAIDLDTNAAGTVAEGVHIAALGGLWQAVVFGFAGLRLHADGLRLDPHLPTEWQRLAFPLQWRGRHLSIDFHRQPLTVSITLKHGKPVPFSVGALHHRIGEDEVWRCRWDEREHHWKEVAK